MSIFPRSTCWWSKGVVALGLAVALAALARQPAPKSGALPSFLDEFQDRAGGKPRALPPFLDDFLANNDPPLITKNVRFPSAVGPVRGYCVRPDVKDKLPAVLIVHDEEAWTEWMKLNTRHLASIGYEVLTLNVHHRRPLPLTPAQEARGEGPPFTDEAALAELSAAVRWLRGRPDVLPNRVGVLGWGWSGGQALALASSLSVQACVVCDAQLPGDPSLIVGLRETPVLAVCGSKDEASRKQLPLFRKLLEANKVPATLHVVDGIGAGFMGPPEKNTYAHDAAEDTWVVIYNFLEKHVEDARAPEAVASRSVATIADIMRAVNEPTGLRGALGKALEHEPGNRKQWERIRANAALMAETGVWLEMQPAPKGPAGHWKEQARAFTAAAEAIVNAADQRDFAAAQRGLTHLAGQCAACHTEHR